MGALPQPAVPNTQLRDTRAWDEEDRRRVEGT
ncbi:hypothetical protein FHS41_007315 [Streptomyces violarus]|uniref:Uncharacterized protein n=1 Tax=Streptomyces violarus TaxID=67380 RepID=A0A7W5F5I7_9ACTN|nr:hypothetical protein [Streptomyces violarus]